MSARSLSWLLRRPPSERASASCLAGNAPSFTALTESWIPTNLKSHTQFDWHGSSKPTLSLLMSYCLTLDVRVPSCGRFSARASYSFFQICSDGLRSVDDLAIARSGLEANAIQLEFSRLDWAIRMHSCIMCRALP